MLHVGIGDDNDEAVIQERDVRRDLASTVQQHGVPCKHKYIITFVVATLKAVPLIFTYGKKKFKAVKPWPR